ncbi:MAG TPA: PAS domain S-box protein, partial [Methanomicrobiales archaeon]|nr:PAS domain S-box protein [Methanomicrobiales archaeon]
QEIFPRDVADELMLGIEQVHRTGQMTMLEFSVGEEGIPEYYEARLVSVLGSQVMGIFRDTSENKRLERAFIESEIRHRALVSSIPIGLFQIDPRSPDRFILVNRSLANMFGYDSIDRVTVLKIRDLFASPEEYGAILSVLESGNSIQGRELQMKNKDGFIFWGRISVKIARNVRGDIEYYDGVLEDITERKVAELALEQANRKLNILSTLTRHDVLNQLTAVRGYVELLEESDVDAETKRYLGIVSKAAQTIQHLVEFTKLYQEMGIKKPEWQNVEEKVRSAVSSLDMGDVALEVETASLEIYADPLLEKVFFNLAENALRHGEGMTRLRFSARISPDECRVICEDNGVGIPQEDKEKIFSKDFGKHTGLGLFLIRDILSITGMEIRETGTQGARFEISVPQGHYRVS